METLVSSASGEAEPDSGETAGGQEQMAENDPTSDGTGTADQADAAADDTDKQNASAERRQTMEKQCRRMRRRNRIPRRPP